MENPNGRLFTRVVFKRTVQLEFGDRVYEECTINDLSLGGMFVVGSFEQKADDTCKIKLLQEGPGSLVDLEVSGTVIRVTDKGVALKFLSMTFDSYLYLQTTLLYEAEDPAVLGNEFLREFFFDIEEDENEQKKE
jgi:hypothetical protein